MTRSRLIIGIFSVVFLLLGVIELGVYLRGDEWSSAGRVSEKMARAAQESAKDEADPLRKVLLIGDVVLLGIADQLDAELNRLGHKVEVISIQNASKSKNAVKYLTAYLEQRGEPDLVLTMIGENDYDLAFVPEPATWPSVFRYTLDYLYFQASRWRQPSPDCQSDSIRRKVRGWLSDLALDELEQRELRALSAEAHQMAWKCPGFGTVYSVMSMVRHKEGAPKSAEFFQDLANGDPRAKRQAALAMEYRVPSARPRDISPEAFYGPARVLFYARSIRAGEFSDASKLQTDLRTEGGFHLEALNAIYLLEQNQSEALRLLEDLYNRRKGHSFLVRELIEQYEAIEEPERSMSVREEYLELIPDAFDVLVGLQNYYSRSQNLARGIEFLRKVGPRSSKPEIYAQIVLTLQMIQEGKFELNAETRAVAYSEKFYMDLARAANVNGSLQEATLLLNEAHIQEPRIIPGLCENYRKIAELLKGRAIPFGALQYPHRRAEDLVECLEGITPVFDASGEIRKKSAGSEFYEFFDLNIFRLSDSGKAAVTSSLASWVAAGFF